MNRGYRGTLPRTPTLEDESYLDFYESVRNFAIRDLFPKLAVQLEEGAAAAGLPNRGLGVTSDQLDAIAGKLPLNGTWKRIMRHQQQSTWHKIRDSLYADPLAWEAELADAEHRRPGRLHYDPAFVVPKYATLDIHLQPGGYVGDTLAGYVFHHGTKVFYQGDNDQDELHHQVVSFVSPPPDGRVERVLDIACSIGQCTTSLKQRFPQAEVWGLDVALPLVRYAHKRAVDLGIDVHFVQALAEDTKFPDAHFDVVLCYILFHEVPSKLFAPILGEFFRVLRPGGRLTVVDAPNSTAWPPGNKLWLDFDAKYNCEPYSPAFVASDFRKLATDAGFRVIDSGPTPTFLAYTILEKPA